MPEGQIIRAVSSFYYVQCEDEVIECKARGLFKKNNITPLVGDYVLFELTDNNHGVVTEVKKRKNELVRPPISNVDQALLVFSIKEPDINYLLLDKFLVHIEQANIEPIICITKFDLVDKEDDEIQEKLHIYQNVGYKIIKTGKFGVELDELENILKDKVTVFSGQSGVGKSTLLNTLLPSLGLETGDISYKLGRGKHTTRVVQLINLPFGGAVADTPGFSQLDFSGIEAVELENYFIEFSQYSAQCRFRGCNHSNEPGCAVKSAVEDNKIAKERYEHYVEFMKEIKEQEQKKWR